MIPRIIHYCWFGRNPLTNLALKCIASWEKMCPGYEFKLWNEDSFNIAENCYIEEAYKAKKWAFVSDYVRLKVLYDYGGVYMDTDVEVIKPLDQFLKHKAFSGFENENWIPTGTMGAEKSNKWIEVLLDYYRDRHFILPDGSFDLTTNVVSITENTKRIYPLQLNGKYQDLGDVVFYPSDVFCAKSTIDGRVTVTKNTITIHHFAGSWASTKSRRIRKLNALIGKDNVDKLVKVKHFIKGI